MSRLDLITTEIRKATSGIPYGQKRFNIQLATLVRMSKSPVADTSKDWRHNQLSYRGAS